MLILLRVGDKFLLLLEIWLEAIYLIVLEIGVLIVELRSIH